MQSTPANNPLRAIPSVDRVLRELGDCPLPKPLVAHIVRETLSQIRRDGGGELPAIMDQIRDALRQTALSRIRPVINGTGIIIHTNFGRSPLAPAAAEALCQIASSYTNLEFDLSTGQRGRRSGYLQAALSLLCNAQGAMVVNNCAAALVLILRHFAAAPPRNKVIISRGELVQIGGGFRVPEILESSGAQLKEIGTTNRTTLDDYRKAMDGDAAMILVVHRSNFFMEGFVESPAIGQIAQLARDAQIPLVHDLGSGALFETTQLGGQEHEPTPAESLAHGASLVTFSGDKLLGGPQAGIIAGQAELVKRLERDPLFRALRCDKLVLAALQATVDLHLGSQKAPILEMMDMNLEHLSARAMGIVQQLPDLPIAIGHCQSQIGGGSLPKTRLPSVCLELQPAGASLEELAQRLRMGEPPVVGRIEDDLLKLDLRTIFPHQDQDLARRLAEVFFA